MSLLLLYFTIVSCCFILFHLVSTTAFPHRPFRCISQPWPPPRSSASRDWSGPRWPPRSSSRGPRGKDFLPVWRFPFWDFWIWIFLVYFWIIWLLYPFCLLLVHFFGFGSSYSIFLMFPVGNTGFSGCLFGSIYVFVDAACCCCFNDSSSLFVLFVFFMFCEKCVLFDIYLLDDVWFMIYVFDV